MLLEFTGFNPLDPRDNSQVVAIDSASISSVVSTKTGDGYDYTTITVGGGIFFVKETVEQVLEKVEEAGKGE
jgi:hypothetical protein